MTKLSRVLILLAAILLGLTFVFPLWEFSIFAPQYPEGLFIQIWTTKITGDVRNVNILNHYIGMRPIVESEFSELRWFSKIFSGLVAFGVLASVAGRKALAYLWSCCLVGFASWAFFDFWKWEYSFGHHLHPDAPIKVEGMTYAPPLIGTKELLNISASSWPGWAGWGITLAVGLAVFVVMREFRRVAQPSAVQSRMETKVTAGLALAVATGLFLNGCRSAKSEPIHFGKDDCASCKMTIVDRRFGVEWVSAQGKVFKFDSLECLAGFLKKKGLSPESGTSYVVEQGGAGRLVDARQASFVLRDDVRSPMGRGFFASMDATRLGAAHEGLKVLQWNEVLEAIGKGAP